MIRIAGILACVLVASGCGSDGSSGPKSPPPAFLTAASGTQRLTMGSYCWQSGNSVGCGDTGPPSTLPGLLTVGVKPGERIAVRLGFDPDAVEVTVHGLRIRVEPGRRLEFAVERDGILQVVAHTGASDVSYYARLRVF